MTRIDISTERTRVYGYMNRPPLIVANPIMLFITEDGVDEYALAPEPKLNYRGKGRLISDYMLNEFYSKEEKSK